MKQHQAMTPRAFQRYLKQALSGDDQAMVEVAFAYRNSDGVEPDRRKYFEWLQKSAESRYPKAMYYLAIAYKDGDEVDINLPKYFDLMLRAAEANDREAMFNVALAYEEGLGTERDLNKYFYWISRMADAGAPGAILSVAIAHRDGKGTPENRKDFFIWARKAVEAAQLAFDQHKIDISGSMDDWASEDLPRATLVLAQAYKDGIGTRRRPRDFFNWIRRSGIASRNVLRMPEPPEDIDTASIAAPMFDLALAYKGGVGCQRNVCKYALWAKKAADAGLTTAMLDLAHAYINPSFGIRDEGEYFRWLKSSAEAGDVDGMYDLSIAYGKGIGTTSSPVEFVRWIQKAVDHGHSRAYIALGVAELARLGVIDANAVGVFLRAFEALASTVDKIKEAHRVTNENDAPHGVGHFTTLDALHNMLPNQRPDVGQNHLRLYNVAYVNDPQEGKILSTHELGESLKYFLPDKLEAVPHDPWEGQQFGVYLGSFSLSIDSLNLWRAYGRNGEGYCIVTPVKAFLNAEISSQKSFMATALQADFSGSEDQGDGFPSPILYKVFYNDDLVKKTLTRTNRPLQRIINLLKTIKAHRPTDETAAQAKEIVCRTVRSVVSDIQYLYKHKEYEAEQEVRILTVFGISAQQLNIDNHVPPRVFVQTKPFLYSHSGSRIIVGPRVQDQTDASLNLRYRLARCGFAQSARVELSEISYR